MKDKSKIKDLAENYFFNGEWDKALLEYIKLSKMNPADINLRKRIGDIYVRLNDTKKAITEYKKVVELYTKTGFIVKALAINKLIAKIDPTEKIIDERIIDEYSERDKKLDDIKLPEFSEFPEFSLFSPLNRDELKRVINRLKSRDFAIGDIICKEGEKGDSIFIIGRGGVVVFTYDDKGYKILLNDLKEGDFFGEFSFFGDGMRHAYVEAMEDSQIFEISKGDFEEITKDFPRIKDILTNFYKKRVLDCILAISPLFRNLVPAEREKLIDSSILKEFKKGDIVVKEGEIGESLFIIKSGKVEIFTIGPNKKEVILANLKDGDFFGEVSLITSKPRTANVRAIEDIELFELLRDTFNEIISLYPNIMNVLKDFHAMRTEDTINTFRRELKLKSGLV